MKLSERLQHELKYSGYSLTKPRLIVFEALGTHSPISMRKLIGAVEQSVDRASVYRTIKLFEECGIVRRIPLGWKYKLELSDKFTDHHHHAHCQVCRKIISLPEDSALETAIENATESVSFTSSEHHLEIHGVCADCRKQQPGTRNFKL